MFDINNFYNQNYYRNNYTENVFLYNQNYCRNNYSDNGFSNYFNFLNNNKLINLDYLINNNNFIVDKDLFRKNIKKENTHNIVLDYYDIDNIIIEINEIKNYHIDYFIYFEID